MHLHDENDDIYLILLPHWQLTAQINPRSNDWREKYFTQRTTHCHSEINILVRFSLIRIFQRGERLCFFLLCSSLTTITHCTNNNLMTTDNVHIALVLLTTSVTFIVLLLWPALDTGYIAVPDMTQHTALSLSCSTMVCHAMLILSPS